MLLGLFSGGLILASVKVSTAGLVITLALAIGAIVGIIYGYKAFLSKKTKDILRANRESVEANSALTRKYKEVNVFNQRGVVLSGGLATSLLVVFLALNWTQTEWEEFEFAEDDVVFDESEVLEIPPTAPPPPPPPPALGPVTELV